jgi:hypothetical protein
MGKSVSGKLQLVAGIDNEPASEFSELANKAGSVSMSCQTTKELRRVGRRKAPCPPFHHVRGVNSGHAEPVIGRAFA